MNQSPQIPVDCPVAQLQVCAHCDTVHRRRHLQLGEVALCTRCGAELGHRRNLSVNIRLALTCTALVAFIVANAWPVLTLEFSGRFSSTTVWGTVVALWQEQAQVMALAVALMLIVFPLMQIVLTGWLLWFARGDRPAPGFGAIMIILTRLRPWSMTEVFVLGLLVCIVKAGAYFQIQLDPGMFGYAVVMLIIAFFSSLDMRQLWWLVDIKRGQRA